MTTIKATTKRGKALIENASYYQGYYLHDVYDNYSHAKERAWDYCHELCKKENGYNFHIISHNTFSFSVAWYTEKGVRIETSCNSYLIA